MMIGVELEHIACALCGADAADTVLAAPNRDPQASDDAFYQLVRCRSCGLQYVNPRPAPGHLAQFYPEQYYAYQQDRPTGTRRTEAASRWLKLWSDRGVRKAFCGYPAPGGRLERWILRLILWPLWMRMRLVGKDLKIVPYAGAGRFLDVGCGSGQFLVYQRQFGLTVSGVEPSRASAAFAREQWGLDVRAGTLEQNRFPADSFDIIHMSHVFEHVPDPAGTLDEARRILSPDGRIILKVPNMASASAERFGAHWLGLEMPRHVYHFDPSSISRMLERHGFRVTGIRQDLGAWGFWRESWRLRAAEATGGVVSDPWWLALWSRWSEAAACLAGRGSAIAVEARRSEERAP